MNISLLEQVYACEALQENPLRIDGGFLSLQGSLLSLLAKAFDSHITSSFCDFLYPSCIYAVPLATHLSYLYDIPLFIEGSSPLFIRPGQTALLVDVSSSFAHAVSCLKSLNISPSAIFLLLEPSSNDSLFFKNESITAHYLWERESVTKAIQNFIHENSYPKIHTSDIS